MVGSSRSMLASVSFLVASVLVTAPPAPAATGIASVETLVDGDAGLLGIQNCLSVAVSSPDGGFVYLTAFADNNVGVFSRNPVTGKMTFIEKETNLGGGVGGGPQALVLSPAGGAHLYVASSKGSVTALERDSGTGLLTFIEVELDGEGGVTGLGNASGITVSPDGNYVYATGEADDSVVIFSRDSGTGELTYVGTLADTPNIAGPRGLTVSPDGLHLYVTGRTASALTVYSRNLVTGLLTFVEKHEDDTAGVDGLRAAVAVTVSPDGAHVYVVGESDDGVAVFSRNPGTGALTVVEYELGDPRFVMRMSSIAVSDDGTHVFAAGRSRDSVVLFDRNAGTGALTFVAGEKLLGASAVAVSPDGAHVYAGTRGDNKLFGVFRLSEVGCSAAPLFGCAQPSQIGKSLLLLKDKTPSDGDTFVWKWSKGPVTPLASFGDPVNTTDDLVVCAYEDVLITPTLVFRGRLYAGGTCASKPCWKTSSTGFKYKDKDRSPDGLQSAGLKSGTVPGQAKIKVKGKGTLIDMPTLPLTTPVVVQLQRPGNCWETTFTTPLVTDGFQFKSKDN